jgi:hypothetical protein
MSESTLLNFEIMALSPHYDENPVMQGANGRGIGVIFLHKEGYDAYPYLEKLLTAAKIELRRDTSYLETTAEAAPPFSKLIRAYPLQYLLVFGIPPDALGLNVNWGYHVPLSLNGITLLFAHPLAVYETESKQGVSTNRAPMWYAVKQLFKL